MGILEFIKKIEGKPNNIRREMICLSLDSMSIKFDRHKYATGENIIVPSDKSLEIGIGSHFDIVLGSPGANDNGSAVAVTLDLLKRFKENPTTNIGIRYFFFDEEEFKLRGSRTYVNEKKEYLDKVIGLYNMEMVGFGDQIALWRVKERDDNILLSSLESQAKAKTYRIPHVITHGADHQSFEENGIYAFSITTITKEDINIYMEYIKTISNESLPKEEKEGFWKNVMQKEAPLFKHHHQSTDLSIYLNERTLRMVSDLLFDSIRAIDQKYSKK